MCIFSDFGGECIPDSEIEVFESDISKNFFKINIVWEILLFITIFGLSYFLFYVFRVSNNFLFLQYFLCSLCDLFMLVFIV